MTLTTDFGVGDYYAGALKGAVLESCPRARLVDLSHEVPAHDVWAGSLILRGACHTFPEGTVHLAVVDPGVGTSRKALVVVTRRHFFVGPDNGLLAPAVARESVLRVISVENDRFWRKPVSPVFHGRDVFGPVAGWLAAGTDPAEMGPVQEGFRQLPMPKVSRTGNRIEATVLFVDRFGNIITNLGAELLAELGVDPGRLRATVNGRTVSGWRTCYGLPGPELPFLLMGSCDFLEIAANRRSAAHLLGVERGMQVVVET